MRPDEFKAFSKAATDFVADYLSSDVKTLPVLPSVEPGYLHKLLPNQVPEAPEKWTDVMEDFKTKIMPGITHWQSPNFHAYFPTPTSYPSVVGEILSAGLGVAGFNWICSPACTELEVIVMDWLAKFLHLPSRFTVESDKGGIGMIQNSASDAILVAIITAREMAVKRLMNTGADENMVRGRLVVYASDLSNSCVEKDAKLAGMQCRLIKTDDEGILTAKMLRQAIRSDIHAGLIPAICVATYGTTATCTIDDIDDLAKVCKHYNMLIHVDAAYAGAALCLPEYSHHAKAFENVDFFNINLHKILNVNYECTAMWCANPEIVEQAFTIDRIYLQNLHESRNNWAPDFRDYQFAYGRRFRALKVWFTLRILGAEEIRNGVRNRFDLAVYLNELLDKDERIEVVHKARMGLVTFCMKSGSVATENLLNRLNESKVIFCVPTTLMGKIVIRLVIGGFNPERADIDKTFKEIQKQICRNGTKSQKKFVHSVL